MSPFKKKRSRRLRRKPTGPIPNKPFRRSKEPRARRDEVSLVEGRSTKPKSFRRYWHVFYNGRPAGRVFIVVQKPDSEDDPDASITVELNEASRGRGIGTLAFRKASELSGFKKVYATMRKSNIASRIAATRAGFRSPRSEPGKELVLVWRQKS